MRRKKIPRLAFNRWLPVKSVPIATYLNDGLPPHLGVIFHDAEGGRVWLGWLGVNILTRWAILLWWYLKHPGHFGPLSRARLLRKNRRLEKKTSVLSHAFSIQEPVLRLARELSRTVPVEQWPKKMLELREEVVLAEAKTLSLYADEKELRGAGS